MDQYYGNKKVKPQHFDSDPLQLVARALSPLADQQVARAGLEFIHCVLHAEASEARRAAVRDVFESLYFDDLMVLLVCCTNDVVATQQNLCRVLQILRAILLAHSFEEVKKLLSLHGEHMELLFSRLNQTQVSKNASREVCNYLQLVLELLADDREVLNALFSKEPVQLFLETVAPEAPCYSLEELARVELWRLLTRLKETAADADDDVK